MPGRNIKKKRKEKNKRARKEIVNVDDDEKDVNE